MSNQINNEREFIIEAVTRAKIPTVHPDAANTIDIGRAVLAAYRNATATKHTAAQPLDLDKLSANIVNLPSSVPRAIAANGASRQAYKEGHRDARHAAAELVNEQAALIAQARAARLDTTASATGELIAAAEKNAEAYDGDDREGIKTDVINAFYQGAAWQARATLAPVAAQQAAAVECGKCNDSGIVGFPPDQYEACPDCNGAAKAPAAQAVDATDALHKLCDQLDAMRKTRFLMPGTGQNYSYLLWEDASFYVEEARKALAASPASTPEASRQAAPFPERDQSKPAEQQGLFRKFDVRRVDGSDQPGGKHYGCRYYVLDLNHDQHAPAAMRAYAAACRTTHPQLADDIEAEFGIHKQAAAVAAPSDEQRHAIKELCHWVNLIQDGKQIGTLHYGHLMRTMVSVRAAFNLPEPDCALCQGTGVVSHRAGPIKHAEHPCNCCGAPATAGAATTSEDVRDAARWRFSMQFQGDGSTKEQPQAIIDMWRKVYAEHRLRPTREEYEAAIDSAMRATQQEGE